MGQGQRRGVFGGSSCRRPLAVPLGALTPCLLPLPAQCESQVRDGAGPDALALYHADERAGSGTVRVARRNFAEELRTGRYRLAVVRRLHRRLTPAQADLVREFAAANVGKELQRASAPASVLQVRD